MLRYTDIAAYIIAALALAFFVRAVLADEAKDIFKSLSNEDSFVEDGECTFGKQKTMCHKVLLPEYPDFVYYVIYNKRVVGEERLWVPIVIKKCSLDLSFQTNIWQNTDSENPTAPTKRSREWSA